MQFSLVTLLAMVSLAAAQCPKDSFYYIDRQTYEPCASQCEGLGGSCDVTACDMNADPQLLCPATCVCYE
ncbi:hypothetical protein B0I35DRAFT_479623 [Stachybotrys elegans]|uniref:TIL domain-containing protein n=1 Tax=Stachybotrys elegans TaxID=80388 RepID=A0A8K0WPT7_9HYPO|nr:hypothetical protein B0I35DRAFT_479623 [Stachybotrys elegans]